MDVPAGWYPDPASPTTSARWWDGSSWTDHTRGLDDLVAPGQPDVPGYAAPAADTVVVPVSPGPDFVAPFVATAAGQSDTAVYPAGAFSTNAYPTGSGYDATLFPDAAPAGKQSPSWGVIALIGALVVVLLAAGALVVKSLTAGSGSPAASSPSRVPGIPSATSTPSPSATGSTPAGTPGGSTAEGIAAGKVLETFKPSTAVLPAGIEATLIPDGDVAEGQRTLDGWCSTSYTSEKDRIARRQWALTQDGQNIGLSIEVVAYGSPEEAAAALAEFTDTTNACRDVTVDQDGTTVTQDVVSAKRMTGLPAGVSGFRATATMSAEDTDGARISVNSTSTMQCKGRYCSIVWTNQSTPISSVDQHVIDGFVAQQTKALAATS